MCWFCRYLSYDIDVRYRSFNPWKYEKPVIEKVLKNVMRFAISRKIRVSWLILCYFLAAEFYTRYIFDLKSELPDKYKRRLKNAVPASPISIGYLCIYINLALSIYSKYCFSFLSKSLLLIFFSISILLSITSFKLLTLLGSAFLGNLYF